MQSPQGGHRWLTLNMCLCTMLKRAPMTPAIIEINTIKGSCSNHSLLLNSATPLKDSTPYFHLQGKAPSLLLVRDQVF